MSVLPPVVIRLFSIVRRYIATVRDQGRPASVPAVRRARPSDGGALALADAFPRPLRLRRPGHRLARPRARPRRRDRRPTRGWSSRRSPPTGAARSSPSSATSARVTLEDRRGKRRTFPLGPGFLLEGRPVILVAPVRAAGPAGAHADGVRARSPCPAPRPGWPGPAGSSSRAGTTPSWSRRSGATTCGSRAWSWSTSSGVDDLAEHLRDFRPGPGAPGRRARRPPRAGLQGEPDRRRRSRKSPGRQARADRRPPVHRHLAGGEARAGSASRRWPTVPRDIEWKKGVCQQLGWPHRDQADIARAWKHILGGVRVLRTTSSPRLLGRVEELIDFVTQPG